MSNNNNNNNNNNNSNNNNNYLFFNVFFEFTSLLSIGITFLVLFCLLLIDDNDVDVDKYFLFKLLCCLLLSLLLSVPN